MQYGNLLRVAREFNGDSRAEAAQQIGATRRAVHYWETGKCEPMAIFRKAIEAYANDALSNRL